MIRWIAVVFAAIVLALAAAVAYLGSADLGRHKEQLTPLVSNALGRELRIVVESDKIDDEQAIWLARDVANKVESELTYPGQIRVTVVRQSRARAFAR